jgi:hypothetical protein
MDEPAFGITQDVYSLLSQYLTDQQLARLGSITKHAASPLAKLQKNNAYWKSRVNKIFPLAPEDYIPDWKKFYLAFLGNPGIAVGKYLPTHLILQWLSIRRHPYRPLHHNEMVIEGLISADRELEFQEIWAVVTNKDTPGRLDRLKLHYILSTAGGWKMLCRRIPELIQLLKSDDSLDYVQDSIICSDSAHFLLVESLLPRRFRDSDLRGLLNMRDTVKLIINEVPQNLTLYLKYLQPSRILEECAKYEWMINMDNRQRQEVVHAREQLFEIVVAFYPWDYIQYLIYNLPARFLPKHLYILRGLRANPAFDYSELEEGFLKKQRTLSDFKYYNSVFPKDISYWLHAGILHHAHNDLVRYIIFSKKFPHRYRKHSNELAEYVVGKPLIQPSEEFTTAESVRITKYLGDRVKYGQ